MRKIDNFICSQYGVGKGSTLHEELDTKFKIDYFTEGSAVQLGWLIDPINKRIYVYSKGMEGIEHGWNDISGDDILPNFTLKVSKIGKLSRLRNLWNPN